MHLAQSKWYPYEIEHNDEYACTKPHILLIIKGMPDMASRPIAQSLSGIA